jgi:hypothetical protein
MELERHETKRVEIAVSQIEMSLLRTGMGKSSWWRHVGVGTALPSSDCFFMTRKALTRNVSMQMSLPKCDYLNQLGAHPQTIELSAISETSPCYRDNDDQELTTGCPVLAWQRIRDGLAAVRIDEISEIPEMIGRPHTNGVSTFPRFPESGISQLKCGRPYINGTFR